MTFARSRLFSMCSLRNVRLSRSVNGIRRARIERCLLMPEKSAFHETYVRAAGAVAFAAIINAKGDEGDPAWPSISATEFSSPPSTASRLSTRNERPKRNCTRDALRVRQSGADLKPPQAAVVKSDGGERCGNVGTGFRQARSREASASEPPQKCRKRFRRCQNRGMTLPTG